MAKRTKEVWVDPMSIQDAGAVVSALEQGEAVDFPALVASLLAVKDTLEGLKQAGELISTAIENTDYDGIVGKLEADGAVQPWQTPVLSVGGRKVRFAPKTETKVTISDLKAIKDMIPKKYEKVTVDVDKKLIEQDYSKGTLEDELKPYVSSSTRSFTKITVSKASEPTDAE